MERITIQGSGKAKAVRGFFALVFSVLLAASAHPQFHQRAFKLGDTTGLGKIEENVRDFELIVQGNTSQIDSLTDLSHIRQLANITTAVGDTLLNHIVPIFDGYNTLHPDQGQAIKDICDLSEIMIATKTIVKAKKCNTKIKEQYAKLLKAK